GRQQSARARGYERYGAAHVCPALLPPLDAEHYGLARPRPGRAEDLGRRLRAPAADPQPADQRGAGIGDDPWTADDRRSHPRRRGRSPTRDRRLGSRYFTGDPEQDLRSL